MGKAIDFIKLLEGKVEEGDRVTIVPHEVGDGTPHPDSNKSGVVMAINKDNKGMVKLDNKEKIMVRTSFLVPMGK